MKKLDVFNKIKPILSLKYILAVIVITYLTSIIVPYLNSNTILVNLVRLFTNAFNAYFEKDYLSNIGLVFVILGSAEIYLKVTKKYYVYKTALVSGILASYILSVSWVIDFHQPAAGTSIVASTMLLILVFYIWKETITICIKNLRHFSDKLIHDTVCIIIGFVSGALILLFYYIAYIESNTSWYLHIGGAIAFSAFYILLTRPYWRKYFV